MELTLIWFPLLKGAITALLLYLAYYFFKSKRKKIGYWYVGLLVAFWVFAPIKYYGTNSVERNVATQNMRTQQYAEVIENNVPVYSELPTFAERMRIEDEYSKRKNEEVQNDIIE